jgi:hypothetical protein
MYGQPDMTVASTERRAMTDTERTWRNRLLTLALEASHDDIPCVEQGLLVIALALTLRREPQLGMARLFRDLLDVVRDTIPIDDNPKNPHERT